MTADGLPLGNYFAGLAEYAFESRLGVVDPPLVDYVSHMLTRFLRADAVYHYRDLAGRRLAQVSDMVAEAEARIGPARRHLHQHIGDFTLFWTGLYPEALPYLQGPDSKDRLLDYRELGKRAYRIAAAIRDDKSSTECSVLERISDQFDVCIHGLTEVRREWERHTGGDDHHGVIVVL
jgi:hypothetical protein